MLRNATLVDAKKLSIKELTIIKFSFIHVI
jgi:hypothetical protein